MAEPLKFTPREYQNVAMEFIRSNPRCNLWAGMGLGKTVTCLTYLDILYNIVGDDRPTLVLAPLRVAKNTWPDESKKWAHLSGLQVVSATGTPAERSAALMQDAPVVCTNYDNLVWLKDWYAKRKKPWPFRRVIADESTRLKSFRLRQGGVRAQALGQVAHSEVKEWISLTGTPSPNGLKDLWGQQWFIDAGQRLGRTYSAFQERWFRPVKRGQFADWTPCDYAQDQIHERLADCSLTIDPKDWFDLKDPIVNIIEIELPKSARAKYKDLEKEMFTQLESGAEVTVLNAAGLTLKCLAKGTEVLTDAGWLHIENVTARHRIWDGIEWVNSFGSVFNGYKTTVECWGIHVTPDHLMLTTQGWHQAKDILNGKSSKRLKRKNVRLPDSHMPRRVNALDPKNTSNLESPLHLWKTFNTCSDFFNRQISGFKKILWLSPRRNVDRCLEISRNGQAPGVDDMAQHEVSMHQPKRQRLEKLRSTRHNCLCRVGVRFFQLLERHGANLGAWFNLRADQQRWQLLPGELPVGYRESPEQQQKNQCHHRNSRRKNDSSAKCNTVPPLSNHDSQKNSTRGNGTGPTVPAPVYDIVNCGPRNRFVVRNPEGVAAIAHNCLQLANGALYLPPEQYGPDKAEEIHDEKLQALGSVVAESGGAPILVAYHFKSDLARLQRTFPQGRAFDSNPETLASWNMGRIPLLFAHPASAGHGLNMQHGGNTIVFFGQWWNLEEHDQIIERIGPVRQKQSGYDRPVFIHYIIAKGTVDEVVMARRSSKRNVQDLLLNYMRGKK